jgi:hypothetical protein
MMMTMTEVVPKTSVIVNHLTLLIAREDFIRHRVELPEGLVLRRIFVLREYKQKEDGEVE